MIDRVIKIIDTNNLPVVGRLLPPQPFSLSSKSNHHYLDREVMKIKGKK